MSLLAVERDEMLDPMPVVADCVLLVSIEHIVDRGITSCVNGEPEPTGSRTGAHCRQIVPGVVQVAQMDPAIQSKPGAVRRAG